MFSEIFTLLSARPHRRRKAPRGTLIFERGDPATTLYVVLHGEVHLVRRQTDGGTVILQRARSGQMLAEASLFAQQNHCAAVAEEDAVLAAFQMQAVRDAMAADRTFAAAFAAHLAHEVREARLRAEILSMKRVADRVAAWLVWNDGELPARGTWHRIATEIGVSREALYRELARRRRSMAPSGRGQRESIRKD